MIYCCGGLSDIGNFRENNEDSIYYSRKTINGTPICFATVCDGIGGMRDGEIASQMITEYLEKWFESLNVYSGDFSALCNSLLQSVNKINSLIIEKTQIEDIQTGSTIAAILLVGNKYFALNVGDSRIYHISKKIVQVSKDDVVFVKTASKGMRAKLSQCIGNVQNIYINTSENDINTGDAFVICSDGLYKHISTSRLRGSKMWIRKDKSCQKKAASMIKFVKRRGERDNISVIIIKCMRKRNTKSLKST